MEKMFISQESWNMWKKQEYTLATPPPFYRPIRYLIKQFVNLNVKPNKLAKALKVKGLMNVQFAVKMNKETSEYDIYILEVNPRASRTVPFVAKATNVPVAKIAARIMAGEKLNDFRDQLIGMTADHTAVKAPVFPFNRFPGTDVILGPEMKSTGEVMGLDTDFAQAFAKSQLAAGNVLPTEGTVFLSVKDSDKEVAHPPSQRIGRNWI